MITLVVITLNEEKNIARCLESVPFASEKIVVDSGSTDNTVKIASQLGAKVVNEPFRGFARQKMYGAELAKHSWILSLDADEALSEEATAALRHVIDAGELAGKQVVAYEFPRRTFHLGRWLYHGGNYPDRQIRLYNKACADWMDVPVHERVCVTQPGGQVKRINGDILHWPFSGIVSQIATINKYSDLRAEQWQKEGRRFLPLWMSVKVVSKFFETYVLKSGWRDGVPGLINAFVSSFATFLRWAKLYERDLKK